MALLTWYSIRFGAHHSGLKNDKYGLFKKLPFNLRGMQHMVSPTFFFYICLPAVR